MKKVLVAVPYYSSFRFPIINGFKKLGYEVYEIDYRFLRGNLKFNRDFLWMGINSVITMVLNLINRNAGKKYQSKIINSYITDQIKRLKPDIFFVIKGESITADTILNINRMGIKTINWMVDPVFQDYIMSWFEKVGPYYQAILLVEEGAVSRLKKLKWPS